MAAKMTPESRVKWAYAGFIVVAVVFGLFRLNTKLHHALTDEAVRNQLRNLHAIARDYSASHGNQVTVQVSALDASTLYNAGIRPPLNGVFPSAITLGTPSMATGVDGNRTVVYDPTK